MCKTLLFGTALPIHRGNFTIAKHNIGLERDWRRKHSENEMIQLREPDVRVQAQDFVQKAGVVLFSWKTNGWS